MHNRPVELIIANAVHQTAGYMERFPQAANDPSPFAEACARQMLVDIATGATLRQVLKALGGIDAPSDLDAIRQRLAAARDALSAERDPIEPPPAKTAQSSNGSRGVQQ